MKKDPDKRKKKNDENEDEDWNRPPFFPFGMPFPFMGNRFGPFDDFEDFFRNMERMMEEIIRGFASAFNFDPKSSSGPVNRPFVWGYRFTFGPEGPRLERFGDVPGTKEDVDLRTNSDNTKEQYRIRREPLVDVIEEEDQVRIIAELPGVDKKDIDLSATEDSVRIDARSEDRHYFKELSLSQEVDPETAKARFKNGILEVIFQKKERRDNTRPINIE